MTFVPVGSLAAYLSVRGAAQARRDILSVQESLAATGETANAAGVGLGRSEAAIAGAGRAAGSASVSSNKLRIAQLGVVAATERYNAVLADENASVATLARAEAGLIRSTERVASVTRIASAEQTRAAEATYAGAAAMRESSAASSRWSQASGGTVKQLGLLFGGFALLKAAINIGKDAAEFQKQMLLVQTQAGASAGSIEYLSKAVLGMAGEVATAPNELATSLYHVYSTGLKGAAALDVVRIAAEGAKVGNADLEETTNALTATVASGIDGVKNMSQAMGELNAIVGSGDMKLSDLNEALGGGILTIARTFNVSLTQVGAALAVFGDNNIRGADAATALRMAIQDLAKPAAGADKVLATVGLTAKQLRDDLGKGGLTTALDDLSAHMTKAGITGGKVGTFIVNAFTKKAGVGLATLLEQMQRFHIKLDDIGHAGNSFGDKWVATTHTASFAFKKLGVEAETAGISLARNATPAVTAIATVIGRVLPAALAGAGAALHPFVTGWHTLGDILGPVGSALHEVGRFLEPLAPAASGVGVAVLSMWAAFKGFQIARTAVFALQDMFAVLQAKASSGVAGIRAYGTTVNATLSGNATEAQLTGRVMQAEFAAIEASAMQAAATVARAAAVQATAYADTMAASKAASDAQVTAAIEASAAANVAAREAVLAAATTAGAAEEAAIAVDTAGEAAAVGWTAILGPLALVGIGVALLVSMFHKSAASSKEATDAAKAYGDVLKAATAGQLRSAIVEQLTSNDVPQKIEAVNKALGRTAFSAVQFAGAVQNGGPQLHELQHELAAAAQHFGMFSDKGKAALTLLDDLNAQSGALADATKKDLADTAAWAGVSSSIDQVSQSTNVGTDRAKAYASMLGIVVDKNGVAAVSAAALAGAVNTVSNAYGNASQSGSEFLTALNTFSQSAGTAADRGALIGATLKSANGDALDFAASMAATTGAVTSMTDAFAQQRDTLKQQSDAQKQAVKDVAKAQRSAKENTDQLAAAEAHLRQVRGNPKSTTAQIKDAEASVTSAQNQAADSADALASAQTAAGKAGALAYKDTERAAIHFAKTGGHLTASIDTTAKGAGDLVTQLQGIQTAAMNAASAMFQHEVSTKGAKRAADDAYNVYVSKTRGELIDQAAKLHLTKRQAKALADEYFGLKNSGDIKKTIETEGTDAVVTVLNRIGQLLANITGQQWNIPVKLDLSALRKQIKDNPSLGSGVNALGQVTIKGGGKYATGGLINGPGTRKSDDIPIWASKGEFMSTADATAKNYDALQAGNKGAKLVVAGQDKHPAGGGGKHITIGKFEQTINYPEPEPVSRLTPRALRMAQIPLASL